MTKFSNNNKTENNTRSDKLRYLELNSQIMNKKDGFFQIEKDKEALLLFLEEVKENSLTFNNNIDKIEYLIFNGFYDNFFDNYSKEEISKIYEIVYSYNFQFVSYMSASKFYRDYALKTDDKSKYLEHYEDRIVAVSLHLAVNDIEKAINFATSMIKQHYQPATPTFLNAGKKRRGELISCFLLELDDSLNSISFNLSTSMYLSKIGGGVALNLSKLRARGESIKEIKNASKGVIPVLKLLEDSFNYADQMGQRKGAGAAYLNIFHYDIQEFLNTKKINADEKSRIQTLSLGITIPSKFFELAKSNLPYYIFAPYSVYKTFGMHLDEMDLDVMYDKLITHKDVVKKQLNARDLLTNIAKTQFESGYPYIIYLDNVNNNNPLKNIGKIKMSNLCTEIFQVQTSSTIKDYDEEDEIGYDISCVLGSLNIVNVMEDTAIEEAVTTGMEALTSVSNLSKLKNAPSINKANQNYHSVGLGAMNLHGFFAKNNIQYEGEEAKDFSNIFFTLVNYYSIKASMLIAKRTKTSFYNFDKSDYKSGIYFKRYIENPTIITTDKVKSIFKDFFIPKQEDWIELMEQVKLHGLYHSYRLAIAPTQSISYIQNSTPSIMPVVDLVEVRTYGNSTSYYPMPYLNQDNIFLYKSAYNMDMMKLIDLVATIQPHIDQGISTILFVTNQTTTKDLVRLYLYAHHKGLKSLYYTRTKNLTIEECLTCVV